MLDSVVNNDKLQVEILEMKKNMEVLQSQLESKKEDKKQLEEINVEHVKMKAENEKLCKEHADDMERFLLYDQEMLEKEWRIKDQEIEIINLEKMLHEKTKETSNYLGDIEFQQKELNIAKESMLEMQELISSQDHKIVEMKSCLDASKNYKSMVEFKEASMLREEIQSKRENIKKITNIKEYIRENTQSVAFQVKKIPGTKEFKAQLRSRTNDRPSREKLRTN